MARIPRSSSGMKTGEGPLACRKVLFVVPRFHTNQLGWINALQESGCIVSMMVWNIGPTEDHSSLVPERLPEARLSALIRKVFGDGGPNCQRYFPSLASLTALFSARRPDLVVIRPHGLVLTFLAAVAALRVGAKVVWYRQKVEPAKRSFGQACRSPFRTIFDKILGMISRVTMTPLWDCQIRGVDRSERWHVIPFCVGARGAIHRTSGTEIRVLTVGKMHPRKRLDLMLDTFARCQGPSSTRMRLVIVGECSTPEHATVLSRIRHQASALGISDKVEFHLNVDPRQMDQIYQDAHLFVLPAEREPASVSIVEALGHGVPVICRDTCGTRCYVQPGRTGFVFSSRSDEDFHEVFLDATSSFMRLEVMAENARQDAHLRFAKQAFIENFDSMLRDVGLCIASHRQSSANTYRSN